MLSRMPGGFVASRERLRIRETARSHLLRRDCDFP